MNTYESIRHPGTYIQVNMDDYDAKRKTVLYLTEDGKIQSMNIATLKRWYKLVGESVIEPLDTDEPVEPLDTDEPVEPLDTDEPVEPTEPETEKSAGPETEKPAEPETEKPAEPDTEKPAEPEAEKPAEPEAPAETMNMSDTAARLESIFDALNGKYFEGKLPRPVITVQSTPRAYGHCSTKKVWREGDDGGQYEINIGAEYLNRPIENTCATLLHEMVHLFCLENEIQDTCQGGRYHNAKFKEEAEKRELLIEYDRTIGWSLTTPTDAFKATLDEFGITENFKVARALPKNAKPIGKILVPGAGEGGTQTRAKSWKYTCPCCGVTIRSTNEALNLICGTCKETLVRH